MARTRKAGFETKTPSKTCEDKNCPFHGNLKLRGKRFTGKVVSDRMQNSVTVEWTGWKKIPKYERYTRTRTRIKAHNPACINASEGDLVRIAECRPLSKSKNCVVIEVLGKEELYQLEKEALEEGRHKESAETEKGNPGQEETEEKNEAKQEGTGEKKEEKTKGNPEQTQEEGEQ